MNKEQIQKLVSDALQDAHTKNENYNFLGIHDHVMRFIKANYKDNPVPSIDIIKELLNQRKELQNSYIAANNSEWKNESNPLKALENFDKYYSNILQNGVETDKEKLIKTRYLIEFRLLENNNKEVAIFSNFQKEISLNANNILEDFKNYIFNTFDICENYIFESKNTHPKYAWKCENEKSSSKILNLYKL